MFKFLRWSLDRRAARHQQMVEAAYQRGRQCAYKSIWKVSQYDVLGEVARLRGLAEGVFNRSPAEAEFDRGVRDVCNETEQELGGTIMADKSKQYTEVWKTRDGREIQVSDMTEDHVRATLNMILRNRRRRAALVSRLEALDDWAEECLNDDAKWGFGS